ncbi:hypothetical protein CTAYLR_008143 [Chrysophaeum taylorii]|uniref:Uncharacterized protein n=1 Tax=Chrysophaeum taylorii TaxID=2483200 RepID=A0AAD7UKF9_9STRA|nr:hypothetical protein CTAYLR_008143 [Chrysophaeum taylorii]
MGFSEEQARVAREGLKRSSRVEAAATWITESQRQQARPVVVAGRAVETPPPVPARARAKSRTSAKAQARTSEATGSAPPNTSRDAPELFAVVSGNDKGLMLGKEKAGREYVPALCRMSRLRCGWTAIDGGGLGVKTKYEGRFGILEAKKGFNGRYKLVFGKFEAGDTLKKSQIWEVRNETISLVSSGLLLTAVSRGGDDDFDLTLEKKHPGSWQKWKLVPPRAKLASRPSSPPRVGYLVNFGSCLGVTKNSRGEDVPTLNSKSPLRVRLENGATIRGTSPLDGARLTLAVDAAMRLIFVRTPPLPEQTFAFRNDVVALARNETLVLTAESSGVVGLSRRRRDALNQEWKLVASLEEEEEEYDESTQVESSPRVVRRRALGPRLPVAKFVDYLGKYRRGVGEVVSRLKTLGLDSFRSVRGDGNCYYRSVAFGIVEAHILARNEPALRHLATILRGLSVRDVVDDLPRDSDHASLCQRLEDIADGVLDNPSRLCSDWETDVAEFNSNLDLALVRAARSLVARFLVNNASASIPEARHALKQHQAAFYPGLMTTLDLERDPDPLMLGEALGARGAVKTCLSVCRVLTMGEDAEGLVCDLPILPHLLGGDCQIWGLFDTTIKPVGATDLSDARPAYVPLVNVLLNPGHYCLLYADTPPSQVRRPEPARAPTHRWEEEEEGPL